MSLVFSEKTQTIAQSLYTAGYTSYPRTSSQKLPESLDFKSIFLQLSKNSEFRTHISALPAKLKPNEGKRRCCAPCYSSNGYFTR